MKIKNWGRFLLFIHMCIFCLVYLYVKPSAYAQYPVNSYYEYFSPTIDSSYLYNNSYLYNTRYSNNYTWSATHYLGTEPVIPTPVKKEWTVQPAFGNTVYAVSTNTGTLTIHGVYFSAHTQAGVNFIRTLSLGDSLYSMPYMQPNQSMYGNIGGQSSYISPINYYARQVLQFSPVLHGPLLNN